MKKIQIRIALFVPRALAILFLLFITWYTYFTFFTDLKDPLILEDILFYFLPTIVLIVLLSIGWKHEKFEGIALLVTSFVFLGIYHVYLSLTAFFSLLLVGTLFLIDDYKVTHRSLRR